MKKSNIIVNNVKEQFQNLQEDNKSLDKDTLEIIDIAYSSGGDYLDEILLTYVKDYFEMNSINRKLGGDEAA